MAVADELRVKDARARRERIHRGVDAQLGDGAREHDRRVEVCKRGCRRRVGDVVGRHVNGLHRRDRAIARRGDALLQVAHLRRQRRLVTHGARHAPEERRHFRTRLREAEDVVDEHQHVGLLAIAEVLGDRQAGESHTEACSGRLVHLAINQRHLLQDARFLELQVEVVPLARALADAAEDRLAAVALGDVVDELLNHDRLAHAGAAEEADLATLHERRNQVDDLDARLEDLGLGLEVHEIRALAVDRPALHRRGNLGPIVHRLAEHVQDAAERRGADRHRDRAPEVHGFHAADDAVGGAHGHRAHLVAADVLLHLGDDADVRAAVVDDLHLKGVVQVGEVVWRELDVEDGTDDLDNLPDVGVRGSGSGHLDGQPWSAAAPPTISAISCVMLAWRARL